MKFMIPGMLSGILRNVGSIIIKSSIVAVPDQVMIFGNLQRMKESFDNYVYVNLSFG